MRYICFQLILDKKNLKASDIDQKAHSRFHICVEMLLRVLHFQGLLLYDWRK